MPLVFSGAEGHIEHCHIDDVDIQVTQGSVEIIDSDVTNLTANGGSIAGDRINCGTITLTDGSLRGSRINCGSVTQTSTVGSSVKVDHFRVAGVLTLAGGSSGQVVSISGLEMSGQNYQLIASGDWTNFVITGLTVGLETTTGSGISLIDLTNLENFYIQGQVMASANHGVDADACINGVFDLQVKDPGAQTNNTYDGYFLTGACDKLTIQGSVTSDGFLGSRFPRYGVNVGASCTNVHVFASLEGHQTAEINNAASGEDVLTGRLGMQSFRQVGTITTFTGAGRQGNRRGGKIVAAEVHINTAPTGSDAIWDVNVNGTSIYTAGARPTVSAGGFASGLAVPDVTTNLEPGDYITIDCDQVGATVAGADAVITVYWEE